MNQSIRLLSTAALLASSAAWASDFLNSGASARSVAAGGVFMAGQDSALDAMAMNPAGLALLGRPVFNLGVSAMFARGSFTNRANSDGKLNSNGAVPYGAFGAPIKHSRITLGFAAMPELMSAARWRYIDTPGGAGNVSYGAMNHTSEILAMRAAAGVGVNVSSRLQLGATIGAVYNTNKLQTAYVFQNHPALAGLKTSLDLNTSGVGWKATVGALVTVSKRVQVGAAYNSRTKIASRGVATGNIGVQLAAIGLGAARPDFRYDAQVDNILPQSAMANVTWTAWTNTRITAQGEWVGWKGAFRSLPVSLTNGNNQDINGVLSSNAIKDSIPLDWRNQYVARVGVEHSLGETRVVRAGYVHNGSPVPGSTLSPLTAAITRGTVSAGMGWYVGRAHFDFAYTIDPRVTQRTGVSSLRAGEYNGSTLKVGTQGLVISTSFRL